MTPFAAGLLGAVLGALVTGLVWWLSHRLGSTVMSEAVTEADDPDPGSRVPEGVQDVLTVLRSGGVVLDAEGRVQTASANALAYGLVRRDRLAHEQLRRLAAQTLRDRAIREAEFELPLSPIAGGRILLAVRVAPLAQEHVLLLVEDRTQARRVEEVRRDFVVNVSHELKTPVGGLQLLAEAVQDAADDPKAVARFAARMTTETERLTRLVSEIIDLSRLQTTDPLADMVIVDVAACAAEAVEHTRLVAGLREVVATPTGHPSQLRIYGDPELVTTAIRNLVTNAINYSEDGTKVGVVTRRVNDVVEVSVSDQGRGISAEDQERVFERFYRVDAARSRLTGGTGLGLSIVKHICANHGGEVTVWSQEGQGSTFTLRLPAVTDDDRPVGSPADRGRHLTLAPDVSTEPLTLHDSLPER
ncbi:sensor histidine kinase [Ornithinimicrobium sufpigmenti]|uniref:sensor histidine kinase n=1 Tax=Ornithinimicrobium sufpigmenti TaxID=2508882 RepID=UPI001036CC64|nr:MULTISPECIES: ATP-binding protein [unclassified Ornithinimicrobium]